MEYLKKIKNYLLKYTLKIKDILLIKENIYILVVFIASLLIHFYFSLVGWSHNLLDQHGFRQTQTAITTYYVVKEGFKLNYITPILGAPWAIPFEFPLFQWIVAGLVIIFKTPIDQTGRFVGLFFFYLTLFPLSSILKIYFKKTSSVLIILSFVLLNHTYLFWSRTFMIESLALFLGVLFCWLIIRFFQTNRYSFMVLSCIVGSLAALVKITTFFVLGFSAGCIFLYYFFKRHNDDGNNFILKKIVTYLLYAAVLFVIPLYAGLTWTQYADEQKTINPLAKNFITSANLSGWNFGTIKQRLDPHTWSRIIEHAVIPEMTFRLHEFRYSVVSFFLLILVLFLLAKKQHKKEMVASLALFLVGPLVFINLYSVHSYYFYANNFFTSIFFGLLIISIYEKENPKVKYFGIFLFPLLLLFVFLQYKNSYYYASQIENNYQLIELAKKVKETTKSDDTILIYGNDWNPSLPYYSERKAIMNRDNLPLTNEKIKQSIENSNKIGALIISGQYDKKFINDQIRYLNFNTVPVYNDESSSIYLPK